MNFSMTTMANRNYIKKMLRFVTEMVMILLCLLATQYAIHRVNWCQLTRPDSTSHGEMGFSLGRVALFVPNSTTSSRDSTFFCLTIQMHCLMTNPFALYGLFIFLSRPLVCLFASCCFLIIRCAFFRASLTPTTMAILARDIYMKIIDGFRFLTFGTLFCYDYLSHIRFLSKRQWLGPVAAQSGIGSLYYIRNLGGCQ